MDWASHMQRILLRLGEDAVCTPVAGAARTVRGMFLKPFEGLDGGMVESSAPRFAGMTSDAAGLTSHVGDMDHGATVVYGGTTYTVAGVEPDSPAGMTLLRLGT